MKTLDQFFPKVTNTLPEGCYIATEEEVGNMILAYYGLNVRCGANNARKGRVVKKSNKAK